MSTPDTWTAVDRYLVDTLVDEDATLALARESADDTTAGHIEVAPNQGAFLALLAQMIGARRILEFGTLAGYSTIWLARATGVDGHVDTLELEEQNAEIARANFKRAGVFDRVDVHVAPAAQTAAELIERSVEPYDLVFIDADKPNNPVYLAAAMELTHPGSVIVIDNVVRNGSVVDAGSEDPSAQGTRAVLAAAAADPRLSATALQTVGSKGWDGFALLLRVG
ncbi:O-methyltransferase [Leifsonia sp. NPDC058230]|uniref:O-methyltransferase n=1 Tax=Leifsonia sp. NPDC058230 TaxID=3346391 RepID=UPI0036D87326